MDRREFTDVRAVIAIGLSGQFGLRGRLPWEGNRGREYVADVERFFELTRGHVLIMGRRTFTSVPDFAFKDRDIVEIHERLVGSEMCIRDRHFGATVTVRRDDGRAQTFRIVGEDEAEPARGTISVSYTHLTLPTTPYV